jgi:hypothetical protein
MHEDLPPRATSTDIDWTLGARGIKLLAVQTIPLFFNLLIYALVGYSIS